MENFERGFTPPVRENMSLKDRVKQAEEEAKFADKLLEMMLSIDPDPKRRAELLILKTGREIAEGIHLLSSQVMKDIPVEQKQEILEYITAVKGGLDTFIESSNLKSEE